MISDNLMIALEQKGWPNRLADTVSHVVKGIYAAGGPVGKRVEDMLHGVWLGHPLHPVLTDYTVGALSASFTLDVLENMTGREEVAQCADATLTLGLLSAGATALAGITDWQHVTDRRRLIGLTHATLNIGATALYGGSALLRKSGARNAGKAMALLGFLTIGASAWLGADLVYARKIGVSHTAEISLPAEFTPALPDTALQEGQLGRVEVEGAQVLLVRHHGTIYALVERCSHLGGPLSEGRLEGNTVVCPWHGSCYRIEDGKVVHGPSAYPQPMLEVRVVNGTIEVRDRQPGAPYATEPAVPVLAGVEE